MEYSVTGRIRSLDEQAFWWYDGGMNNPEELFFTLSDDQQKAFLRYISLLAEADAIISRDPALRATVDQISRFTPAVQRVTPFSSPRAYAGLKP